MKYVAVNKKKTEKILENALMLLMKQENGSYIETAREVTARLDRRRIEERKDRDWGVECIKMTRDDSGMGEER